ncbi:CRISPR-associated endonuclease Cas2 [Emticicia soli]|uniref:CRISPR-associated endoribonuclease Cas2 n=1 Tax=Emticicia soli TaxID=2027878 RepID=A0ABW5J3Y8_9BACT
MLYLIAYDLENDSIRQRIAKRLLATGLERIQYSLFIGPLSDTQYAETTEWLQAQVKKDKKHSLLNIPLHNDMLTAIEHFATEPLDWEYLAGNKLTMFF